MQNVCKETAPWFNMSSYILQYTNTHTHTRTHTAPQHPCPMVCNIFLCVKIGCSWPSQPLHTSQTSIKGKARFNYCARDCRRTILSRHTHTVGSFIVSGHTQLWIQLVSGHLLSFYSFFLKNWIKFSFHSHQRHKIALQ